MSLYSDTSFMLYRSSSASRLKVDQTLRVFRKDILKHGEASVYKSLSPEVKYNLCCSRVLQRNFREWDGWQYRSDWAATMLHGIKTTPFWQGEPTDSLIVIGEQGIGDEVLFASLIPEAMIRCKEVTYACDPRLVQTLERSLRCKCVGRSVDARDMLEGHTAYIPAADLFTLFRKRPQDFPRKPFLRSCDSHSEFEKYRGRTGVSWRGRHGFINPLELKLERPLSLQYDEMEIDEKYGIEKPDLDLRNDIEGVLTLISVLEKVVCVPTSVMHFAGGLGKKCEIILTHKETELAVDGVVDELDFHVAKDEHNRSVFYANQFIYDTIESWKRRKQC